MEDDLASLERAALAKAPPGAVVAGSSLSPDGRYGVVLTLAGAQRDYPMDGIFARFAGRWEDHGNGGGTQTAWRSLDGEAGVVPFADRAPEAATAAWIAYEGREVRVPVRSGYFFFVAWDTTYSDDPTIVRFEYSLDRVRDADGRYPLVAPKSRASRRDVPLTPEDVARLRKHRLASGRPPDGAFVFANADGEPLSPVPAYHAWKRACRSAIVAPAMERLEEARVAGSAAAIAEAEAALKAARSEPLPRPHDTRHAYATHLLALGMTAHAVADLMGHEDAALVTRRYGHALPEELASAGDRLSAWRKARGL